MSVKISMIDCMSQEFDSESVARGVQRWKSVSSVPLKRLQERSFMLEVVLEGWIGAL